MEVAYSEKAKLDIAFWKKSGNKIVMNKITLLIEEIKISPYSGTGKPEALKHQLSGLWSRRINREHRIVYEVGEEFIKIHSLKDHY